MWVSFLVPHPLEPPRPPRPQRELLDGRKVLLRDLRARCAAARSLARFPWQSENRLPKTEKKYNDAFGTGGAFVFANGFCRNLAGRLGPGTLLLDATPVQDELAKLDALTASAPRRGGSGRNPREARGGGASSRPRSWDWGPLRRGEG